MTSGIYQIVNTKNGKIYTGQSKNIEKRITTHFRELSSNKHFNVYLQKSWNKHGRDVFDWKIVDIYPEIDEPIDDWMTRRETEEIAKVSASLRMNLVTPQKSRLSVIDNPVYKCSMDGSVIKKYKTARQASIDVCGNESLCDKISQRSCNVKKYGGFYWARVCHIDKKTKRIKKKKVIECKYYGISLSSIDEFPSGAETINEARKKWNLTRTQFKYWLNKIIVPKCGFYFSENKNRVFAIYEYKKLVRIINNMLDNFSEHSDLLGGDYLRNQLYRLLARANAYEKLIPDSLIESMEYRIKLPDEYQSWQGDLINDI